MDGALPMNQAQVVLPYIIPMAILRKSAPIPTHSSHQTGGQFPIPTGGLFGRKPKQTGALLKADHREAPCSTTMEG